MIEENRSVTHIRFDTAAMLLMMSFIVVASVKSLLIHVVMPIYFLLIGVNKQLFGQLIYNNCAATIFAVFLYIAPAWSDHYFMLSPYKW